MLRPSQSTRPFLALALGLLALAAGCNRELQAQAEVLLDALDTDDYAKLEAVAGQKLLADFGEGAFHDFAATYDQLGPLADKSRNEIAWNNGVAKVGYHLEYANGEVSLVVVSESDELDGFELRGAGWTRAVVARHQTVLEALMTAVRAGDREAVRTLLHPSLPDADVDALAKRLARLGAHRRIEVTDETIPEFRVIYEGSQDLVSLRMSAARIIGYNFRPEPPN